MRPKLTFANAIALIALFISLGGTVYAAAKINGRTIRKASIPADRVKADSLTSLQINEQLLGTVPNAAKATIATRASQASQAGSATRATRAMRAEAAGSADSASTAVEAEHAGDAASALRVPDVPVFGGQAAARYLQKCAGETVLAAATIDFNNDAARTPFVVPGREFNCAGGQITVESPQKGESIVTIPNLPGGIPIVSPEHGQLSSAVQPLGSGRFRVNTGFATAGDEPASFSFTLAIFGTDG
ncbi:MAG TPA: hypothetical protein VFX45_10615 [Solirubrobacterales bacterium]|nr:hypothetical protein [Solirubrobacterales bacterium]